jgi:hypothetical protein
MVLDTGLVIKEEGADPSRHGARAGGPHPSASNGDQDLSKASTNVSERGTSQRSSEAGRSNNPSGRPSQDLGAGLGQQGQGSPEGGVVVEQGELERLRAAAEENAALKVQLEALRAQQAAQQQ